jgi:hypothetical protein
MSVQIKYTTKLRQFNERHKRFKWFTERIPSNEFLVGTPRADDSDIDLDDMLEVTVTIWAEDAERIATEFWFKFP